MMLGGKTMDIFYGEKQWIKIRAKQKLYNPGRQSDG